MVVKRAVEVEGRERPKEKRKWWKEKRDRCGDNKKDGGGLVFGYSNGNVWS